MFEAAYPGEMDQVLGIQGGGIGHATEPVNPGVVTTKKPAVLKPGPKDHLWALLSS